MYSGAGFPASATIEVTNEIVKEVAQRMGTTEGNILGIMLSLGAVINDHLRRGDKVRLRNWGMMKLEIESYKGKPELYQDIEYIKVK